MALSLMFSSAPRALLAQGVNPVVMHTGSGATLLSQTVAYMSATNSPVMFNFGFATAEHQQPGVFLDSFTISINGPTGTGYLVTADAGGIHWAPLVPGAMGVSDPAVQRQSIPFPVSTEGLASFSSYFVSYSPPPSWRGAPLTFNLDLFDNKDPLRSFGYFAVTAVPEPSGVTFLILGLMAWRFRARKKARGIRVESAAGWPVLKQPAGCTQPIPPI